MTVRMRLRRWARTQGKRRAAARTKRSAAAGSRRRAMEVEMVLNTLVMAISEMRMMNP